MSSLDLRVLVLERQRWQLQKDLDDLEVVVSGGLAGKQPLDATLTALAALVGTPNTFAYFTATESMALTALSPYSRTLLDDADAATWRSTLGLGTLATANAPLSVAQGGTGGTDAGTARTNLGLGTMSIQNAHAVAINGGTLTTTSVYGLSVPPGVPTFYDEVGFGAAPQPGYSLYAQYQSWFGSSLKVDGTLTVLSTSYLATTDIRGYVGIAGAPSGTYWFRNYGNSYFDGQVDAAWNVNFLGGDFRKDGTTSLRGYVGIGDWAQVASGWTLYNHGSMYTVGAAQFMGVSGMSYAPVAGISLRASSGYWDFLSVGGGIDTRFSIRWYGDVYAGAANYAAYPGPFVAYSDERMKTNIQPIPHPLETMCALHGVLYEWIDPSEHAGLTGLQMGVIAQEVEDVLPEWVGELSGYKTTQLSKFEALAIESIKELTARVAALEGA